MHSTSYTVVAHFADSGGIYQGGEVSYRGVKIGQVSDMRLTRDGVDVVLSIDKGRKIPADTLALVANKSAVGEQYVDLEPRTDKGPYLHNGSSIAAADTLLHFQGPLAIRQQWLVEGTHYEKTANQWLEH